MSQKEIKEYKKLMTEMWDFIMFLKIFSKKQIKIINKVMKGNWITLEERKEFFKELSKSTSKTLFIKAPEFRFSRDKKVQFKTGEKMWEYCKRTTQKKLSKRD